MHLEYENTDNGGQWVYTSRSGRRYTGATQEDAERKWIIASLHAAQRELGMVRDLCARKYFGITSFSDLNLQQLRELNNEILTARRFGKEMSTTASQEIEPKATNAQIKRIVKLGRYSIITEKYGKDFFWNKCKEWMPRFKNAARINLDDLTNQEAWYLVKRLEKIEKRLAAGQLPALNEL